MSQAGNYLPSAFPVGFVETLTGNSGGAVPPAGTNINVVGDGTTITVAGNPGTSTLTISAIGLVAESFVTDSGTATPIADVLNIKGAVGGNISTSGATNVVSIAISGTTNHSLQLGNSTGSLTSLGVALNGQIPIGSTGADPVLALPSNGSNISWTGGVGTLTADLTGTTNHSLQLGNVGGSLTSLGVASNGQIPIGSAGADPVLATITPGTGISISNGAGTITISATGTTTLNYMNVNTTPYVVAATDDFLGVDCSGGPITIELPNAPATGRVFIIKDRTGSAAIGNVITVTTVGGAVNIDGATSFAINTSYEAIQVLFDGSTYQIF